MTPLPARTQRLLDSLVDELIGELEVQDSVLYKAFLYLLKDMVRKANDNPARTLPL